MSAQDTYYELVAEVRAEGIGVIRHTVTVSDPALWTARNFELPLAALCKMSEQREGVWYVTPSRAWQANGGLFGGEVRLLGFRRISRGTLAHNVLSAYKRAAADAWGCLTRR